MKIFSEIKAFFEPASGRYLVIACLLLAVVFAGCLSSVEPGAENATKTANAAPTLQAGSAAQANVVLTLIKFRGNQQCTSCINLGKFANATVQQRYAAELASGSIRYLDINAEADPQNELVLKYRPTHASLYVAVNRSGAESFEELVQAWSYTGDESAYAQYLSGVIDGLLR